MSNQQLLIEPVLFQSEPLGLWLTAKRYTSPYDDPDGITLLFAHCIGSHKEQWEPIIEAAFLAQRYKPKHQHIREAISFDWQSHGDAAILNEEALEAPDTGVSTYEWTSAISSFIKANLRGHRIVLIGHSAGAAAMVLTTREFVSTNFPFVALFLVEPTMITKELYMQTREDRESALKFIMQLTRTRRHEWSSKEQAFEWMRGKFPWVLWDERVVRLYAEFGLKSTPPSQLNEKSSMKVTLKCNREQEALSYAAVEAQWDATMQLAQICCILPVHFIFGARDDIVPEYVQESLGDVSAGRIPASVSRVEEAGHMIIQERPNETAQAIEHGLDSIQALRMPPKL